MVVVKRLGSNFQVELIQENEPAGCFTTPNINVSDFWENFAS